MAGGVFWSAGSQQSRGPRIIIREGLHYISTVAVGMIPGQWIFHLVSPADLTMGGNIFTGNIGIFPMKSSHFGMVSSQAPSYASLSKARRDGV